MLSDREKLVLHFCCSMTIAKMMDTPHCNRVIAEMMENVRRSRCRSIAPEDMEDLLEEINEEMMSGRLMFQHLAEDTVWSMTGEQPNKNTNWKDMR